MLDFRRPLIAAVVTCVALAACAIGADQLKIHGNSMAPTIKDGQIVSYDKNAYSSASPKRGDIIVFKLNGNLVIKRVIGLPGETVSFKDGSVYINGKQLSEPYLDVGMQTLSATESFQVPANSYFVLSDNRIGYADSRTFGPVNRSDIVGKINL